MGSLFILYFIFQMTKVQANTTSQYKAFKEIATRWMDNDMYGHINNVVYYSWFDTAVNAYLIEQGALHPLHSDFIGLVIETHCNYFAPLSFPETVKLGIRVAAMGRTSVRYEIGVFSANSDICVAQGHFVHVYVDALERRPIELPSHLKKALQPLLMIE